jgi:hypothetical protein
VSEEEFREETLRNERAMDQKGDAGGWPERPWGSCKIDYPEWVQTGIAHQERSVLYDGFWSSPRRKTI